MSLKGKAVTILAWNDFPPFIPAATRRPYRGVFYLTHTDYRAAHVVPVIRRVNYCAVIVSTRPKTITISVDGLGGYRAKAIIGFAYVAGRLLTRCLCR